MAGGNGLIRVITSVNPKDVQKVAKTVKEVGKVAGEIVGIVAMVGQFAATGGTWAKHEVYRRRVERAQNAAKAKTNAAKEKINSYRSILSACVRENHKHDWASLQQDILSGAPPPSLEEMREKVGVPRPDPRGAGSKEKRAVVTRHSLPGTGDPRR